MERLNELRMTLIILLFGVFFVSGCFFDKKYEVTFKTNGGTKIESVTLKSGAKLEDIKAPEKKGYKFVGWYQDGKKFDLDTKIEGDITLVAKWEKVEEDEDIDIEEDKKDEDLDISYDEEEEDEEETTTKKVTTKKKKTTTTRKKTTTTKNKTSKVTTTTKYIESTTTTTEPITVVTTTSTTTTTTNIIDVTTIPTSSLTTETTTTSKVVKINIAKVEDVRVEVNEETNLEEEVKYETVKLSFDLQDDASNVESNISVEDFDELMNSDKKEWKFNSNTGVDYLNVYDPEVDEIKEFNLTGNKESVYSITISNGLKHYVIDYDSVIDKWFIKYPTVTLGVGLDVNYYSSFDVAIPLAKDGDVITLLSDIEINNTLVIDKLINLDFNNKNIICNGDYLIEYKGINSELDLLINNLNGTVNNFIKINDDVVVNKIIINNSNVIYNGELKISNIEIPIVLTNTSLSGVLK